MPVWGAGSGDGNIGVYTAWPPPTLAIAGYAPSIAAGQSQNATATPAAGTLTIVKFAPTARPHEITIAEIIQQANAETLVELFEVDCTSVGGVVLRFVSGQIGGALVRWQGNDYTPYPIEADGFEQKASDGLPRPRLRAANINHTFTALLESSPDLVGCPVTRWRTFQRFLDGQQSADPNKYFEPDRYVIERKVTQNPVYVEWELSVWLDQQGLKLPRRQVLRDYCSHVYRYWNGTNFDYSKATCPYAEIGTGKYFDEQGTACTADKDRCGKRLSDCKARFGSAVLPFRGFPGVSRVKVS